MGRLVSAGFRGGRTCFGWFQGGKDWFRLVSGWEGLVSAGFVWEGLVSGGFGSFRFLVTTSALMCNNLGSFQKFFFVFYASSNRNTFLTNLICHHFKHL